MPAFIECTSLNINFNVMGVATVTYTIVSDDPNMNQIDATIPISAGGQVFSGYVTNASMNQIPHTSWYEIHVTLVSTTN